MADLYNLDDEILNNELDQQEEDQELDDVAAAAEDWDNQSDREEIELPDVLAAKQNLETEDEPALDLQDFAVKSTQQLQDLPYTCIYTAWSQECRSPELLPLDQETVLQMREAVAAADDHDENYDELSGNVNMDALFKRILHIDTQRCKFLLADLLKRRLQKIEAHPLFMRTMVERMSEEEVCVWHQTHNE